MQIRKVKRSTIHSHNIKKTDCRPLKLLTIAIKDFIVSPRLVQGDLVKIVQASSNSDATDDVTIELTMSNNNKAKKSRVILVVK
jgi:hypothetical protein